MRKVFKSFMNKSSDVNLKGVLISFKNWPSLIKLLLLVDKSSFFQIIVLTIITGLTPAFLLILNQQLINSVQTAQGGDSLVIFKALLFLIITYIFQIITNQFKKYKEELFSNKLSYSMKSEIMKKTEKLTVADFENANVYDQLQRATSESNYRPYQIFNQIMSIIGNMVTMISTSFILFLWNWWLIPVLFLIPIFSSYTYLKLSKLEYNIEWERTSLRRKLFYYTFLMTRDINIKEIKLYNLGSTIIKRYNDVTSDFIKIDKKISGKRFKITSFYEIANQLVVGGLMFYIISKALLNEILIGTMITYIQALTSTQNALKSLAQEIFMVYENNLYVNLFFQFLNLEENESNVLEEQQIELKEIESVTFKNVYFKYPNTDEYVLKNINIHFEKKDVVAIVGKNGSGKSTFIKLLMRLYKDYEGEILINSIPIDKYSLESIRKQIGVVFQDYLKFELSVRENIGFGNIKNLHDETALYEASKVSGANIFVNTFSQRFDTQLGKMFSKGVQLSGGEWQKIAISRAVFKEASLYILDEPSSALDAYSEKEVFNNFHEFLENKIGIYISHRYTTVNKATQIIVFEDGEIIEKGTHQELIDYKGVYYNLYYSQASVYLKS